MSLLAGCVGLGWQTTYSSIPTLGPSETWSHTEDGTFAAPGMKLRVTAYNDMIGGKWGFMILPVPVPIPIVAERGEKPRPPPFRISITFDPAEGGFTFDPGRVRLASETIRPMAPSDFWACSTLAGERPVRLEPGLSCFYLIFDVEPPAPEREFTLLLDGLTRGDMLVALLRIQFKPSRRTLRAD